MVERRARLSIYVGPKETLALEGPGPEAMAEFNRRLQVYEDSGDYVFEVKHDGFWCLASVAGGLMSAMCSRTGVDFEGAEVRGLLGRTLKGFGNGQVMGELTADIVNGEHNGTRRLHLFDVPEWNGIDLRDLPQTKRREALVNIYQSAFACDNIHLVEQRERGIVKWFYEIIANGGEGIVGKRRDAKCRAKNSDGKIDAWFRAKPKHAQDLVVLSHGAGEKGMPNLDLGLYRSGKLVKVQTCPLPIDVPGMRGSGMEGVVVEVIGWEIFPSGAVRSGHIKRIRTDKLASDCRI